MIDTYDARGRLIGDYEPPEEDPRPALLDDARRLLERVVLESSKVGPKRRLAVCLVCNSYLPSHRPECYVPEARALLDELREVPA